MAFTLVSISQLDDAGSSVTFSKGMCIIKNPNGQTMATIPQVDGLYHLVNLYKSNPLGHVNIAAGKMSISEAHRRLRHMYLPYCNKACHYQWADHWNQPRYGFET